MGKFEGLYSGPDPFSEFDRTGGVGRRKNSSDLLSVVAGGNVG
jgi:hypothetical protein